MKRQESASRIKVQKSSHAHFFLQRFILEMRHVQKTKHQSGRASKEKNWVWFLVFSVWISPLLSLAVWHKSTLKWRGNNSSAKGSCCLWFFFPDSFRFYNIFQSLETAEVLWLAVSSQRKGRRKKWSCSSNHMSVPQVCLESAITNR